MILFLDDDPDLGTLFEKKFSTLGEDIYIFKSIKKLRESNLLNKASILCFDINLHPENGIEFLREVGPEFPHLSYICFSNYSDLLEDQLHEVGVHSYVCKDDGIEELKIELERILEERRIFELEAS
jgi:DNA-binding NtrC family response regulator